MLEKFAVPIKPQSHAGRLLRWYDLHRRDLPWRAPPGSMADPYAVWLSEIMLQQTTVATVQPYYAHFLAAWPSVGDLAKADDQTVLTAWAGLGYYARARNLIACARQVVAEHGGRFPGDEQSLLKLPGIGSYTAAAIAAIAFDRPALVIDGNVERVVARLFAIGQPLPAGRTAIRDCLAPIAPDERPGDFAQAMMDLGATICTPRVPACLRCPLESLCLAALASEPELFPVKAAKRVRPIRQAVAFVVHDRLDRLLLRTRPGSGLLGGMAEVPNSPWLVAGDGAPDSAAPPLAARWRTMPAPVIHVFTHFELRVTVKAARVDRIEAPPGCRWVPPAMLDREPLPTLMKKVIAAAGLGDQAASPSRARKAARS